MADFSPNCTYSASENTHFYDVWATKSVFSDPTNDAVTCATSLCTRGCAQHAATITISETSVGGTMTCHWRTPPHHGNEQWEQPAHTLSVVHCVVKVINTIISSKASDGTHHSYVPSHSPSLSRVVDERVTLVTGSVHGQMRNVNTHTAMYSVAPFGSLLHGVYVGGGVCVECR